MFSPKKPSSSVGLDLETGSVAATEVRGGGSSRVARTAIQPLSSGVVSEGEVQDSDALSRTLRSFFSENKLGKTVRLGVANQRVVVRTLRLPLIEDEEELETAIRFQAQDQIPMPLDSAVLDYQPLDIVETENGPRQRVLIVAARRDMIDRVMAACKAAGLKPEGIDLSAFAMIRALHRAPASETPEPVLYLSVGGLTNLAVAEGTTCLFTRVVGGGLEAIAVELA